MNTAILSYQFEEEAVRVVMTGAEPWFVAADVAKVLGYDHAPNMTRMMDDDEKGVHNVSTLRGEQEMTIVSESGLYSAIFRSRREEAIRFRKWVTSVVLPSIRKTGSYALPAAVEHDEVAAIEIMPDVDAPKIMAGVALVREARRLYGSAAARDVWAQIGLPLAIVDAVASMTGDPILEAVRGALTGRQEVTRVEVARAVGVDPDNFRELRRVSDAMTVAGWRSRTCRRGGVLVKRWMPLSVLEG